MVFNCTRPFQGVLVGMVVLCLSVIASAQEIAPAEDAPAGVTPADVIEAAPPVDPVATGLTSLLTFSISGVALLLSVYVVRRRSWRLDPRIGPIWASRPDVLLGGWILLLLATPVAGWVSLNYLPASTELQEQAYAMLASYTVQAVVIMVLLIERRHALNERTSDSGMRAVSKKFSLGLGLCVFFFAITVAMSAGKIVGLLQSLLVQVAPEQLSHDTLQAMNDAPSDPWSIVIIVLVVLITPLIEEFAYRGLLQQGFRKLGSGRASAIFLTSMLFVFMHIPVIPGASMASAATTLLILSFCLGWVYERTGRLLAPVLVHALFNGSNLLLFHFGG